MAGLFPPHLGGEELAAQALARAQAADGHRVTVYTSTVGAPGLAGVADEVGVMVRRLRARTVAHTPLMTLLPALLRHRPRPGVVHLHSGHAGVAEQVRLACWLRNIPYVVHMHLLVRPAGRAGELLLPVYERTLHGALLRGAQQIICLTGAMQDELVVRHALDPRRVSVVANAAPIPTRAAPHKVEAQTRRLLFVGRLTEQKNVLPLVEAMALMPDVTLRVVGDGEQKAAVWRLKAERSLANVQLMGRLTPDEVQEQYAWADALVMPSTHEGMPLVLLEAFAAGLPVIAAGLPELLEAGGDALVVLPDWSPQAIAATAVRLLNDCEERRRLSALAEDRYAGRSWHDVSREVASVYERACSVGV